jgi:hypothetical protein
MANPTYILPDLGDILGAHHDGNLHTEVFELKPDLGVLTRGTVLSIDSGTGKLVKTTAANETAAYGVLLNESVDTAVKFGDGTVTASVARSGTFRGAALIVGVGTNVAVVKSTLRDIGIYVEGVIVAPTATALEAEA